MELTILKFTDFVMDFVKRLDLAIYNFGEKVL